MVYQARRWFYGTRISGVEGNGAEFVDTAPVSYSAESEQDAGSRVFRGDIARGDGLVIRSVIWFSDIRNFTAMSGRLSRLELIDLINTTMELTAETVKEYGGQTLKFMGDGLMAIFSSASTSFQRDSLWSVDQQSIDDDQANGPMVCRQARQAAAALQRRLAELAKAREAENKEPASVGIGLHYGDVSYGNIGAPERLDFTVLGPEVNLASRTESLTSKLGCKVLCTKSFHNLDCPDAWHSKGEHQVKGVSELVSVFELVNWEERSSIEEQDDENM